MSENNDVFNSRDEMYLVFTSKKVNFLFIYIYIGYMHCLTTEKGCAEYAKTKLI